jgi:hypothetical protein
MGAHFLKLAEEAQLEDPAPFTYLLRHFICYTRFITGTPVDFARKVYSLQNKQFLDRERPVYTILKKYLLQKQRDGTVSAELNIDAFCDYVNIWLRVLAYDWCLHDGDYDLVQASIDYTDRVLAEYRGQLGS